ncbi:MAG: RdgB/HAM1 family non-canonical purine NTP pyrophosphatase [Xanthomonadales bacterium]|nr:RdgB/HAM1 family non-canonical purine NTP pyrophosphatase [Xanthomonadales bacterium]
MAEAWLARRTLVLASGNAGKLRELGAMLRPLRWSVRPQSEWAMEEAVENGLSFIENALIKARHAARLTGLPALGDDSGLVVDALDGGPGIYSSRFAGEGADDASNNRLLLEALAGVGESRRGAHFYCAMALLRHAGDPAPLVATGKWDGRILEAPAGSDGFGYDPLFWLPGLGCTAAQLPADVKNRLSHRGQALAALLQQLEGELPS